MFFMRRRPYVVLGWVLAVVTILPLIDNSRRSQQGTSFPWFGSSKGPQPPPTSTYLPEPTRVPPPIKDPFPALTHSDPPPIPAWNVPKEGLYKKYNLDYVPPLFIGFTRLVASPPPRCCLLRHCRLAYRPDLRGREHGASSEPTPTAS